MHKSDRGQISAEFVIITGFIFVLTCMIAFFIGGSNELIFAMAAAKNGADKGAIINSLAVYPEESFANYIENQTILLSPYSVKIVKIDYQIQGFSSLYNRRKIQLRIYAETTISNLKARNCIGDRINYYARKSISETFNTQNLSNSLFNPAFSDRYYFTTCDVQWI